MVEYGFESRGAKSFTMVRDLAPAIAVPSVGALMEQPMLDPLHRPRRALDRAPGMELVNLERSPP
jgi:hypothetical protein